MKPLKTYFSRMSAKGECPERKPPKKILWSWLGAFLGIFVIAKLGELVAGLGHAEWIFLIGSFGASAVLTYGAPMAEFSQPRNLVLGHVVSALVGVTAYKLVPDGHLALTCALAVSTAVLGMHVTRSLHPPGGATALIAVINAKMHDIGYWYVLFPVFLGAMVLLAVALMVNNLSRNPKRHYPVYWW
jgi:CBS-domain-containing membrane protein